MFDLSLCVLINKDASKQHVRLWLCVGEPRGKVNCHNVNIVHWIDKVAQLLFFVYIYACTFSL